MIKYHAYVNSLNDILDSVCYSTRCVIKLFQHYKYNKFIELADGIQSTVNWSQVQSPSFHLCQITVSSH